jgi:hypothetical protein
VLGILLAAPSGEAPQFRRIGRRGYKRGPRNGSNHRGIFSASPRSAKQSPTCSTSPVFTEDFVRIVTMTESSKFPDIASADPDVAENSSATTAAPLSSRASCPTLTHGGTRSGRRRWGPQAGTGGSGLRRLGRSFFPSDAPIHCRPWHHFGRDCTQLLPAGRPTPPPWRHFSQVSQWPAVVIGLLVALSYAFADRLDALRGSARSHRHAIVGLFTAVHRHANSPEWNRRFRRKIDLASLACGIGQMHLKEHAVCQSNVPNRWTRIGLAGLPR